ncbi:MAG TPA: GrpB family protein [Candidatus Limnocylindrales bacterium]
MAFAEYDPSWPELFAREEARIRSILGDRALAIEHTGSTSVPGLAAKPIIDITMIVADVTDEAAYARDLEDAGYVIRIREGEPDWYDHRVFKGPDTKINLHVFSAGSVELERMVGFRDWLRLHDDDRDLYERTKRELIKQPWAYVQNYADAKTGVVEEIVARAGLPERRP